MSKTAFVFPGQGSQKVGMGREWADAFAVSRETFEEADEALGMELSRLCWEGPEEELQLTVNTQPALLATASAVHRAVAAAGETADLMAGHSLGEYTALVAAGSLDFADALRLVRERGRFMQEAVPVGQGAMAAVMGLAVGDLEALAAGASTGGEVCVLANLNSEFQTVLAGHHGAVERAVEAAREAGARKAVMLAVSAPFHSPLMAPARKALAPLLAAAAFADPRVPVVTNVDAAPVTTGEAARDALERQVDGAVRWTESVEWMAGEGSVSTFVEIGPGKTLTGLNRRIAQGARCLSVALPDDLEKLTDGGE